VDGRRSQGFETRSRESGKEKPRISARVERVNRTCIMKYKGKLKELLPTEEYKRKSQERVQKAAFSIRRLIEIAAARKIQYK